MLIHLLCPEIKHFYNGYKLEVSVEKRQHPVLLNSLLSLNLGSYMYVISEIYNLTGNKSLLHV